MSNSLVQVISNRSHQINAWTIFGVVGGAYSAGKYWYIKDQPVINGIGFVYGTAVGGVVFNWLAVLHPHTPALALASVGVYGFGVWRAEYLKKARRI